MVSDLSYRGYSNAYVCRLKALLRKRLTVTVIKMITLQIIW